MFGISTEWWILYFLVFISASVIDTSIKKSRSIQQKDHEFSAFGQSIGEQKLLTRFFENIYKPYSLEDFKEVDSNWAMQREENPPSLYDVMDILCQVRDGDNYNQDYHNELIGILESISEKLSKISEALTKRTTSGTQK